MIVKRFVFGLLLILSSLIFSSCNVIDVYLADLKESDTSSLYDSINNISLEAMPANLTVYALGYRSFLGLGAPEETKQGSGIIFYEEDNSYYILTCNHVVELDDYYGKKRYRVIDYKNNEYEATKIWGFNEYDLAILRFQKVRELVVLELASEDPKLNDIVFAIGQPNSQKNTLTIGKVIDYRKPNCESCDVEKSNVKFDCIYHTAPIDHGSSGGALLNVDKQIVGINTFGSENLKQGISVPASKIKEFIQTAIDLEKLVMVKNEQKEDN